MTAPPAVPKLVANGAALFDGVAQRDSKQESLQENKKRKVRR